MSFASDFIALHGSTTNDMSMLNLHILQIKQLQCTCCEQSTGGAQPPARRTIDASGPLGIWM